MPLKRKRQAEPSFARLDVWARGVIWGLHSAGIKREEICTRVVKVDGTPPSLNAVDMVIAHKADNPQWRGAVGQSSGRPQSLSEAQKKLVLGLVFEERGRAKVTVKYCKQMLRFLRKLSRQTGGLQCVNPCTSTARVMFRPCSTHVPHMFHTCSIVIRSMFHSSLR